MGNGEMEMGHLMRTSALTLTALALAGAVSAAQSTPPAATPSTRAVEQPTQGAPAPEVYSYNPEGRRDPFVSLLSRGADATLNRETRPVGREGLGISEISVRGIVRSRNSLVAMVQGPDNKTYIIHTGDKMLDGVVKAITTDSVVFAQDVNDPLSLVKQREVRKMLRGPEEGK
jgi:type IV pilus assembly protein PilP